MDRYWSRAKNKITKEWLYGFYEVGINPSTNRTEAFIQVINDDGKYGMTVGVVPETAGGYVMEGKKGKPVFAGDIVRMRLGNGWVTGVVEWDDSYPQYLLRVISDHNDATVGLKSKVEVVGNIYDNPELLRASK